MKNSPEQINKARKGRNTAIAIGIAALMALFFFITIAKYTAS
jgi:hypothetical protein